MGAFEGIFVGLATTWLTHISLGAGILAAVITAFFRKNWDKKTLFFQASNVASAIVLLTVLCCIWMKPTIVADAILGNTVVVTWGIIYALHDNFSDIFSPDDA